jgi:hypothetical protein
MIQTISEQNALRRLEHAADRAISEYPLLAAPDGRVSVDLDDLNTVLKVIRRATRMAK